MHLSRRYQPVEILRFKEICVEVRGGRKTVPWDFVMHRISLDEILRHRIRTKTQAQTLWHRIDKRKEFEAVFDPKTQPLIEMKPATVSLEDRVAKLEEMVIILRAKVVNLVIDFKTKRKDR